MKTAHILKISSWIFASAVFAACSFAKGNAEVNEKSSENAVLTDSTALSNDSCSVISKSVGDTIEIELKSNPSTGYSWRCDSDSLRSVEFAERKFKLAERKGMMMGAGGTDVWTFKAVAEGEDTLKFKYRRSWENDSIPSIDSTKIIVRVCPEN